MTECLQNIACRLDRELATEGPGRYRRPLPSQLISFASAEGRIIFQEALSSGGLENYFRLAEQFHTQIEPAYCGISSLVMVLNALQIDPGRLWKGNWRWYSEDLADCCDQLPAIKSNGTSLEQLAVLARCNGLQVQSTYGAQGSADTFRTMVRTVASEDTGRHILVSYSRKALGQTGDGHCSPIGGYHAERDLVLLLDVARFKYPTHWVPLPLIWNAIDTMDKSTMRSRGYLVLSRKPSCETI